MDKENIFLNSSSNPIICPNLQFSLAWLYISEKIYNQTDSNLNQIEGKIINIGTKPPLICNTWNLFIILITTLEEIKVFFKNWKCSWGSNTKFIIKSTKNIKIQDLFQLLYQFFIINVIINQEDIFYSYKPLKNCGRNITQSIYKTNCEEFVNKATLKGYSNCNLKIFAVTVQPYIINLQDLKNPGYEIIILKELGKKLNYQIDFIKHNESNWGGILHNGSFTLLYKKLYEKQADVIVGMVMANETYYKDFSPTNPYSYAFLSFYTPSAKKVAGWETFILAFDTKTWILLIISGFLTTITWWLINYLQNLINDKNQNKRNQNRDKNQNKKNQNKDKNQSRDNLIDSAFKIWCIIFSAFNTQPKLNLLRLIFLLWASYCFIINCTYQSLLISFLTKPTYGTQITNVKELLESDLDLGGFWSLRNVFYQTGSPQLDLIYKKWINCPLNEECVNRTAFNRDFSVFKNTKQVNYLMDGYYTETSGRLKLYQFKELHIYFIWMVFVKNFPLLDRFNEMLLRMTDSGLILKWDRDSQRFEKNTLISDEYQAFSLDDLKLCFVILCGGYVIAIIVFIFERWQNRN